MVSYKTPLRFRFVPVMVPACDGTLEDKVDQERATKVQLKVRLDPYLRDHLEAAATEHGVSINREIVDRLERSRRAESPFDEEAGGKTVSAITEIIGQVLWEIARIAELIDPVAREEGWLHSPHAVDQAIKGVSAVIESFHPPRPSEPIQDHLRGAPWMGESRAGASIAKAVLKNIATEKDRHGWQERVRAKLGDLIVKGEAK